MGSAKPGSSGLVSCSPGPTSVGSPNDPPGRPARCWPGCRPATAPGCRPRGSAPACGRRRGARCRGSAPRPRGRVARRAGCRPGRWPSTTRRACRRCGRRAPSCRPTRGPPAVRSARPQHQRVVDAAAEQLVPESRIVHVDHPVDQLRADRVVLRQELVGGDERGRGPYRHGCHGPTVAGGPDRAGAASRVVHRLRGCGWPSTRCRGARQDGRVTSPTTADPERPLEPLWRGLLVYRVLALLSAGVVVLVGLPQYRSAAGAVAVLVVMAGWTAVLGYGYLVAGARSGRRGRLAVADVAVTVAVMASTPFVQTPAQLAADAPVMGSIWTPGAVLACALCFGVRGGLAAALVVSATLLAVQARPGDRAGRHPADRAGRADRGVRGERAAPAGRAGPPGGGRRGGRAGARAAGPGGARRRAAGARLPAPPRRRAGRRRGGAGPAGRRAGVRAAHAAHHRSGRGGRAGPAGPRGRAARLRVGADQRGHPGPRASTCRRPRSTSWWPWSARRWPT